MAKMTKADLVDTLASQTDLSKKQVNDVLTALTETAYREIKKNGEFTLAGLGKFVKAKRKARMGRNPMTGKSIKIPAKTVVKFRVAQGAKDAV